MFKYLFSYAFFLMSLSRPLTGELTKRDTPLHVKSSVIIPCHAKHFTLLPKLINAYAYDQTVQVDEIVVSLSDIGYIRAVFPKILNDLKNTSWPIPVILIENVEQVSEGGNRNLACKRAIGDILICQDADDLPHKQRVEVIKYFFENYHLDHIIHQYCYLRNQELLDLVYTDIESLNWFVPKQYEISLGANGVVAISRDVFNTLQWNPNIPHATDVDFNRRVYDIFENRIAISEVLYLFRINYFGD